MENYSINTGENTYLTKRKWISMRGNAGRGKIKEGEVIQKNLYKGKIWCPRTKNGTWVARRNGRIFITGNTFPEALCDIPLRFGCPKDGILLDPFCGSGTALLVAKKLRRNFRN